MPTSPRRAALLIVLLGAFAGSAAAQPAREVGLAEAVRLALAASPELRRAAVADQTGALAESAARAQRLPSVSAQLSPAQQYGLAFDQTTGQLTQQTTESVNVGLGADLRLLDGGRTRAAVAQARFERAATAADAERAAQTLAADVAQRFLQLLLDRELVRVQADQLAAAETQRRQVLALVEGGARPRGDLIAQDAVVAERRAAVVEAEGGVARSEVRLVEATGLDPLAPVAFVGPSLAGLEAAGALALPAADLADLLARARASRADLRAQALRVDAARAAARVARAQGRPTLDVQASAGTGYSSLAQRVADPSAPSPLVPVTLPDGTPVLVGGVPFALPAGNPALERTPFFVQGAENRSGRIGLALTVPLFDRYTTRRQTAEAALRADDAALAGETLARQVAAEVQLAAVEARTAAARLEAARAQVAAAEAALRVERDRYDAGAGTLYLVAEAQSRLAQAESARAQAAYTLVFRAALVRLVTGETTPEALADQLDALGR